MFKVNLKKYVGILETIPPHTVKDAKALLEAVEKINVDADIDAFIKTNQTNKVRIQKKPLTARRRYLSLSSTSPTLRATCSRRSPCWDQGSGPSLARYWKRGCVTSETQLPPLIIAPPATATFGVPVDKIMERQKEKYPELEIPRILPILMDAIFKLEGKQPRARAKLTLCPGPKNEGIFRIPANATELRMIKEKMDQGDYDICSHTSRLSECKSDSPQTTSILRAGCSNSGSEISQSRSFPPPFSTPFQSIF